MAKSKTISITETYLNYKYEHQKIYGKKCVVLLESGHFMEMYDNVEDSDHFDVCRDILNIQVTRRDKDPESSQYRQYMAGIPTHSIKRYYKTLLKNNFTVIVVEQTTPAPNPEREVTKILSPGCSLSEDTHNDSDTGNSIMFSVLIEVDEDNDTYIDVCSFDNNIGSSEIQTIIDEDNGDKFSLLKELLDITNYNELLITIINENRNVDKQEYEEFIINRLKIRNKMFHINYFNNKQESNINDYYKLSYQTTFLETIFSRYKTIYTTIQENLNLEKQVSSLIVNYIVLLNFISRHDKTLIKKISKPIIINPLENQYLKSFNETYNKLNIFDNNGNNKSSLFKYIDNTSCKSSKRVLIERLKKPLIDHNEINRRYDFIDEMIQNKENIKIIDKYLNIHDLQRIYRRFSISKLNPYEIPRIEFSNNQILNLIEHIQNTNYNKIKKELLPQQSTINNFKEYCQEIIKIFDMEKCSKTNIKMISDTLFNTFIFKDIDEIINKIDYYKNILTNVSKQLGYFIVLNDDNKKFNIQELNKKLETNDKFINFVSLKSNDKEGYWLDVTKSRGKKIKDTLEKEHFPILIVNIDNNEYKFNTKDIDWNSKNKTNIKIFSKQIKDISNNINSLQHKLINLTKQNYLFEIERIYEKYYHSINQITDFITNIDIIKSNAKTADLYKYSRPIINENKKSFLNVQEIRHPIIERIINSNGEKYVPNSILIDENNSHLIYGVNSVGKSSLLKSLALSIIMAQSGFFVPAKKMEFSIYKKIFSRMGNNDDLFQNHSSFVKEMIESKEIIKNCDSNSFIIADELCSSTENESAIKIVSSIIKILSEKKTSFVFATHIFKLTEINLIKTLKNINFKHLKVNFDKELVFDRTLTDGLPENKQYGSIVAEKIIQDDIFQTIMNNNSNFSDNINIEQQEIVNKETSNYNNKLILDKCHVCNYRPENKSDIPLETHHINMQCEADSNGFHGIHHKNELHNLVSLCKKCHQNVHKDIIIIDKYISTDSGKKLVVFNQNKEVVITKSKKKKKKYTENEIQIIQNYYKTNNHKTKKIILIELKNKYCSKLSNQVFEEIINGNY